MRDFMDNNSDKLSNKQMMILGEIYANNKSETAVAEEFGISKQAVSQTVKRVINKYKLKWQVFVKKSGNKVKYNLSEVING